MKSILYFGLLLNAFSLSAAAQSLIQAVEPAVDVDVSPFEAHSLRFKADQKLVASFDIEELATLNLYWVTATFHAYHPDGATKTFLSIKLSDLIDAAYKDKRELYTSFLITSTDGYKHEFSSTELPASAYVGIAERKRNKLRGIPERYFQKTGSYDQMGPYYLYWEKSGAEKLQHAYQFNGIEAFTGHPYIDLPSAGESASAKVGYQLFRTHCLKCHRINGIGGKVGAELNQPRSILTLLGKDKVASFITDPSQWRSDSKMSAYKLDKECAAQHAGFDSIEKQVGALVDYLESIKPK